MNSVNPDQFPKPPKKSLQDLPEKTKRKILIISVSIFTIILLIIWLGLFLKNAKKTLSQTSTVDGIINNEEWEKFQLELNYLLEEGRTNIDQIVEQAQELPPTTTPQTLSDKDLEILKNKLLELKSTQE